MKILIAVVNFQYLTGAEMYVYELSRELTSRGHEVTVASRIGGEITKRARKNGVEVVSGDRLPKKEFDLLHLNEYNPSALALNAYPGVPAVATVHSEYPCEQPFIHGRIRKYICIRDSIRRKVILQDGIPAWNTVVIPNGIDMTRFNTEGVSDPEQPRILFCGTVDYLRRAAALDMIRRAEEEGWRLEFIGRKFDTYLENTPRHVSWLPECWDIEKYVKRCTATAGILFGRTTIESWACGRPQWIYDIDLRGNVMGVECEWGPRDLSCYDIRNVTDRIEEVYEECLS